MTTRTATLAAAVTEVLRGAGIPDVPVQEQAWSGGVIVVLSGLDEPRRTTIAAVEALEADGFTTQRFALDPYDLFVNKSGFEPPQPVPAAGADVSAVVTQALGAAVGHVLTVAQVGEACRAVLDALAAAGYVIQPAAGARALPV